MQLGRTGSSHRCFALLIALVWLAILVATVPVWTASCLNNFLSALAAVGTSSEASSRGGEKIDHNRVVAVATLLFYLVELLFTFNGARVPLWLPISDSNALSQSSKRATLVLEVCQCALTILTCLQTGQKTHCMWT